MKLRDKKNSRTQINDIWPKFEKISLPAAEIFKSVIFFLIFSVLDRKMSNNVENDIEKVDPITNCKSATYKNFRFWLKTPNFHDLWKICVFLSTNHYLKFQLFIYIFSKSILSITTVEIVFRSILTKIMNFRKI